MVARSGSSLRYPVRHKRDEVAAVAAPANAPPRTRLRDRRIFANDDTADLDVRDISKTNRRDNSSSRKATGATTKKVSARRNNNASVKQTSSPPPRALPPPPSSRSTRTTSHSFSSSADDVLGHERPLKRAKLDGSAAHYDSSSTNNPATKLPLRGRNSGATRTRLSRDVNNNTKNTHNDTLSSVTLVPPPANSDDNGPGSPAPAISRQSGKLGNGTDDAGNSVNGAAERKPGLDGITGDRDDASTDKNQDLSARRERRTLRSNDGGSRCRSELAQYFPNYEQILSLEDVKPEFLSAETPVILVDDLKEPIIVASPTSPKKTKASKKQSTNGYPDGQFPHNGPSNPLVNLYQAQVIKLPSSKQSTKGRDVDPLGEDIYFKSHRRIERQEKQLRNIEKERAQHEKVQLDRLLEELQSHDWLRTMGISGITDTEKKLYEPKRLYFMKEVSALINKFKVWKEEEKRRKAEREQLLLDELEEKEERDHDEQASKEKPQPLKKEEQNGKNNRVVSPDVQSNESPDVNDIDALAARQLQQEASIASDRKGSKQSNTSASKQLPPNEPTLPTASNHINHLPPVLPPSPEGPFKSFFSKPHLREAAMGKSRRGRMRLAFGQPLPEVPEKEFSLPSDILTPEAIIACQRKKRRLRREQKS